MSTTTFTPANALPAQFVASGATSIPATVHGLTITSDEPLTSTQIIETTLAVTFASDPSLTNPGKITDTTGGGKATSANVFIEINTIGSVSGNTILGRLQFTAPTLADGQSIEDNLAYHSATSLTPGGALDSNIAVVTSPIDVVTAPSVTGAVANQPDGGSSLDPFATMVVKDADFKMGALDTATITVTDPSGKPTDGDGLLTGIGLSKTGVGTYSIPNPVVPGMLTTVLQNLKFTPIEGADQKTTNFEVDATDSKAQLTHKDTGTSVITPPDPTIKPMGSGLDPNLEVKNTTTSATLGTVSPANPPLEAPYPGPVVGPKTEYINITPDSLNITAKTPNWFLHSGAGSDGIQASGGINVIDGGEGSNFLTGGTGAGSKDTFFVDARNVTKDIWSTMVNFHAGDDATMWGITPSMFNIAKADNEGATGFTGLTFHATAAGKPEASLTLAGFSQADLTSGKITQSFGHDAASNSDFMLIHAV